jgi:hypothetical protein
MSAEITDDDKWLVVNGRRWRRTDPSLPPAIADPQRSAI